MIRESTLRENLNAVKKLLEAKEYNSALERLREVEAMFLELKISRDYQVEYFFLKGKCLVNLQRRHEAILAFKKAVELDKNPFQAYLELGLTYEYLCDLVAANENYDEALNINKSSSFILAKKAYILMLEGQVKSATKTFLDSLEHDEDKNTFHTRRNYAEWMLLTKQYEAARNTLKKVAEKEKYFKNLWNYAEEKCKEITFNYQTKREANEEVSFQEKINNIKLEEITYYPQEMKILLERVSEKNLAFDKEKLLLMLEIKILVILNNIKKFLEKKYYHLLFDNLCIVKSLLEYTSVKFFPKDADNLLTLVKQVLEIIDIQAGDKDFRDVLNKLANDFLNSFKRGMVRSNDLNNNSLDQSFNNFLLEDLKEFILEKIPSTSQLGGIWPKTLTNWEELIDKNSNAYGYGKILEQRKIYIVQLNENADTNQYTVFAQLLFSYLPIFISEKNPILWEHFEQLIIFTEALIQQALKNNKTENSAYQQTLWQYIHQLYVWLFIKSSSRYPTPIIYWQRKKGINALFNGKIEKHYHAVIELYAARRFFNKNLSAIEWISWLDHVIWINKQAFLEIPQNCSPIFNNCKKDLADARKLFEKDIWSLNPVDLQKAFTEKSVTIMNQFLNAASNLLGHQPPCHYAMLAVGSTSRKDRMPCSDVETVFIYNPLKENNPLHVKAFVFILICWWELCIIRLGETPLLKEIAITGTLEIKENTMSGFRLDNSSHLLLHNLVEEPANIIKYKIKDLIHAPANETSLVDDESLYSLLKPSLVNGENEHAKKIFEEYNKEIKNILNEQLSKIQLKQLQNRLKLNSIPIPLTVRQSIALFCLLDVLQKSEQATKDFFGELKKFAYPYTDVDIKINIKVAFYKPLTYLALNLKLYYAFETEDHPEDMLKEAINCGIIDKYLGELIKNDLYMLLRLRIALHMKYGFQQEEMSTKELVDQENIFLKLILLSKGFLIHLRQQIEAYLNIKNIINDEIFNEVLTKSLMLYEIYHRQNYTNITDLIGLNEDKKYEIKEKVSKFGSLPKKKPPIYPSIDLSSGDFFSAINFRNNKKTDEHLLKLLENIIEKEENFPELDLSNCAILDDNRLEKLLEKLPYLEHLKLNNCSLITEKALKIIGKKCKKIKRIDINNHPGLKIIKINNDAMFEMLEEINLNNCIQLAKIEFKIMSNIKINTTNPTVTIHHSNSLFSFFSKKENDKQLAMSAKAEINSFVPATEQRDEKKELDIYVVNNNNNQSVAMRENTITNPLYFEQEEKRLNISSITPILLEEKYYNEASELLQRRDYASAISYYNECLKLIKSQKQISNSLWYYSLYYSGIAYLECNKIKQADDCFSKSLLLLPNYQEAMFQRNLFKEEEYPYKCFTFISATKLIPILNYCQSLYYLAVCKYKLGEYQSSIQECNKILKISSINIINNYTELLKALSFLKQEKFNDAEINCYSVLFDLMKTNQYGFKRYIALFFSAYISWKQKKTSALERNLILVSLVDKKLYESDLYITYLLVHSKCEKLSLQLQEENQLKYFRNLALLYFKEKKYILSGKYFSEIISKEKSSSALYEYANYLYHDLNENKNDINRPTEIKSRTILINRHLNSAIELKNDGKILNYNVSNKFFVFEEIADEIKPGNSLQFIPGLLAYYLLINLYIEYEPSKVFQTIKDFVKEVNKIDSKSTTSPKYLYLLLVGISYLKSKNILKKDCNKIAAHYFKEASILSPDSLTVRTIMPYLEEANAIEATYLNISIKKTLRSLFISSHSTIEQKNNNQDEEYVDSEQEIMQYLEKNNIYNYFI